MCISVYKGVFSSFFKNVSSVYSDFSEGLSCGHGGGAMGTQGGCKVKYILLKCTSYST